MNRLIVICVLILGVACQPPATPIAVGVQPTDTEAVVSTVPPPIRYAFHPNTEGFVTDLTEIEQSGIVVTLSDDSLAELGTDYDVIMTYGEQAGWTTSPHPQHIALLINPNLAPFDDPEILNLFKSSLNPTAIIETLDITGILPADSSTTDSATVKSTLANLGYPDGFALSLGESQILGSEALAEQLTRFNFHLTSTELTEDELIIAFDNQRLHLGLIIYTTPEARASWSSLVGEDNIIDLYTIPISYNAQPELQIDFTAHGWVIARYP